MRYCVRTNTSFSVPAKKNRGLDHLGFQPLHSKISFKPSQNNLYTRSMEVSCTPFPSKQNLQPWLYQQILSGKFDGLIWDDQSILTFRVPWVKETEPGWEKYYELFHAWAKRDGKLSIDNKKAKRNFRAAIKNSAHFKFIKEVKQQICTFHVYQFLTDKGSSGTQRRNISEDSQDSSASVSPGCADQMVHSNNPDMFHSQGQLYSNVENCLNYDQQHGNYYDGAAAQPRQVDTTGNGFGQINIPQNVLFMQPSSTSNGPLSEVQDAEMMSIPSLSDGQFNSMYTEILKSLHIGESELDSCRYTVAYNDVNMTMDDFFEMKKGCKIVYGTENSNITLENLNLQRNLVVPHQIVQFPLEQSCPNINKILVNMSTGILFWYKEYDMSIYMVHHCKSHVFFFNINSADTELVKVDRGVMYKLFSYKNFINSVHTNSVLPSSERSSIPAASKIEIYAGCRPDKPGFPKGVRITLQPLAAPKILACENLSSVYDVCMSSEVDSLAGEFENARTCTEPQCHQNI